MLSSEQFQVLEGLMLGDGHLPKPSKNGNTYLTVTRAIKDVEYQEYHASIFQEFLPPKGLSTKIRFDRRTNKYYESIILRTRSCAEFGEIRKRWYPEGIKIVPKDLTLTPLVMATWIADDGTISVCKTKKKTYPNLLQLKLCTNGFRKEEVEWLSELMKNTYGVNCPVYQEKSQHVIRVSVTEDLKKILRVVDSVFPLERKKEIWNTTEFKLWQDRVETNFIFTGSCPRCKQNQISKNAVINGIQRYLCNTCKKQFLHMHKIITYSGL